MCFRDRLAAQITCICYTSLLVQRCSSFWTHRQMCAHANCSLLLHVDEVSASSTLGVSRKKAENWLFAKLLSALPLSVNFLDVVLLFQLAGSAVVSFGLWLRFGGVMRDLTSEEKSPEYFYMGKSRVTPNCAKIQLQHPLLSPSRNRIPAGHSPVCFHNSLVVASLALVCSVTVVQAVLTMQKRKCLGALTF